MVVPTVNQKFMGVSGTPGNRPKYTPGQGLDIDE